MAIRYVLLTLEPPNDNAGGDAKLSRKPFDHGGAKGRVMLRHHSVEPVTQLADISDHAFLSLDGTLGLTEIIPYCTALCLAEARQALLFAAQLRLNIAHQRLREGIVIQAVQVDPERVVSLGACSSQ